MRDEFLNSVKRTLAERVGFRCSNPNCRKGTSGPRSDPDESVNIGVAAHITAAAEGGPRYNPDLSSDERRSPENGIWLCQNCAKLVDNDPERYTSELLYTWKSSAEARALQRVRGAPAPRAEQSTASVALLSKELDQLAMRVSSDMEERLEEMHETWRRGEEDRVLEWLRDLKNDPVRWPVLSQEVKAGLLRFEAVLRLQATGDTSLVRPLADEARQLVPEYDDARLRALLVYHEAGPEAALSVVADRQDIDSLNLRAAFLLEANRVSEGREILEVQDENIEPDAETFRLRALSYLETKDISQARLEIQKALELKPEWESVRFTAATINYYSGLSSVALPGRIVAWPEPVHWGVVKSDDQSVAGVRNAEQVFRELAERSRAGERQRFEGWRLACLAIDAGRQEEANEYCKALLDSDSAHIPAILWALARNYDIDLQTSRKGLEKEIAAESPRIPAVLALVECYLQSGDAEEALQLLSETRTSFEEREADALWVFWYAQSEVISGNPKAALETISRSEQEASLGHVRTLALRALAEENDDWQPLVDHLEKSYEESEDPALLFEFCGLMALRQEWDYVADRAELLVKQFGTSETVRLGP
ncbi:MAG: hypothetical protein ACOC6F_03190 [bacterium]